MKKTTIVAFLLLLSNTLFASPLKPEINQIESQWAQIYYTKNAEQQRQAYPKLIRQIKQLSQQSPQTTELKTWLAIILATNAAYESPFNALDSLNEAKKILEQVIQTNPKTLGGSALVTLGTLYYLTPGWPISFGNDNKAEKLLKQALQINPDSIDANYFYADYLLTNDQTAEAEKYLKRALMVPIRIEQKFADTQLKKEAYTALKKSKQRKVDTGRFRFQSLFSNAKSD